MNDTISREAAIETLWAARECLEKSRVAFLKDGLPSIAYGCKIERNRVEEDIALLRDLPAAQFQRLTVDGVTLYRCDPAKNTACSKTGCFADGGQCYLTKHKDFEKTEESAE